MEQLRHDLLAEEMLGWLAYYELTQEAEAKAVADAKKGSKGRQGGGQKRSMGAPGGRR